MKDLSFIEDAELRKTLEDSIEYVYTLYEQSKNEHQNDMYRVETYRVIILYTVSAIEAVLFYFYKARGEKMECIEYKHIHTLPPGYTYDRVSRPVVVAVQNKAEKRDHQIGLHDLVTFFRDKKLVAPKTADTILEMDDVRNTFHFSKPRTKLACDVARVEAALKMLVYTLERAPRALRK